jgi:hypothetical protein
MCRPAEGSADSAPSALTGGNDGSRKQHELLAPQDGIATAKLGPNPRRMTAQRPRHAPPADPSAAIR